MIHMFAVVNWMKSPEQDLGFGNSLSVWLAKDFEIAGQATFACSKDPLQVLMC